MKLATEPYIFYKPSEVGLCVRLNYRKDKGKMTILAFSVPKGTETSIRRYPAPQAA
jgi:hypothetical protein